MGGGAGARRGAFERKAALMVKRDELKLQMRSSHVAKFREEAKNRCGSAQDFLLSFGFRAQGSGLGDEGPHGLGRRVRYPGEVRTAGPGKRRGVAGCTLVALPACPEP